MSYQVPKIDVLLGGVYTGYSGTAVHAIPAVQQQPAEPAAPSSRRQIFLEPRGTEKNDFYNNFDLRAEKAFKVPGIASVVFADIFNLFNTATVTTRQARYPRHDDLRFDGAYKAPTAVQGARQLTFGGRWMF